MDLHRAGGADRYLEACVPLAQDLIGRFYDADRRDLFFVSGDDPTLVRRPKSDPDGATPSALGLATLGLARVAGITGRADLREVVQAILKTHSALASRHPLHLPTLVRAAALVDFGMGLGLILGDAEDPRTQALASRARDLLGPEDAVVLVTPGHHPTWLAPEWVEGREVIDGSPTAYLCRGTVCSLPAQTAPDLCLP